MNYESLGKTVNATKLANIIHRESSGEGLYKTHAGDIKVDESLELANPSQGRGPRSCRQFSLCRMLGE